MTTKQPSSFRDYSGVPCCGLFFSKNVLTVSMLFLAFAITLMLACVSCSDSRTGSSGPSGGEPVGVKGGSNEPVGAKVAHVDFFSSSQNEKTHVSASARVIHELLGRDVVMGVVVSNIGGLAYPCGCSSATRSGGLFPIVHQISRLKALVPSLLVIDGGANLRRKDSLNEIEEVGSLFAKELAALKFDGALDGEVLTIDDRAFKLGSFPVSSSSGYVTLFAFVESASGPPLRTRVSLDVRVQVAHFLSGKAPKATVREKVAALMSIGYFSEDVPVSVESWKEDARLVDRASRVVNETARSILSRRATPVLELEARDSPQACAACHNEAVAKWSGTRHSIAFGTLEAIGAEATRNVQCVLCHTTGFGLKEVEALSKHAVRDSNKGVQCLSCHSRQLEQNVEQHFDHPVKENCFGCHTANRRGSLAGESGLRQLVGCCSDD